MINKKLVSILIAVLISCVTISAQTNNKDIYSQRRQRVIDQLEDNSIAILRNPKPVIRNNDQDYFYRTNSNFYYLTGHDEPGSILALIPNADQQYILFVKPTNLTDAMWHGDLLGIEGAVQKLKADKA